MRKIVLAALLLLGLLAAPLTAWAAEDRKEIAVFNAAGQKLPLNPSAYTADDATMLPLRDIAEYLGAEVEWQPSGEITLRKGECAIALAVGRNTASRTLGGQTETLQLAAPPCYQENTLFVPLRFVAEALETPVNYCVDYQDDYKLPVVILGNSEYAENYSYEDLPWNDARNAEMLAAIGREVFYNDVYTWDELNYIRSIFVGWTMGIYAEAYNLRNFGYNEQILDYLGFHIADEVLASPDWQKFLTLAQHQGSEISATPLQITVTEDKISGTFGFETFEVLYFIPLLAEVEITRCDDSLQAFAPANPFGEAGPQTDTNGHMWRVTKVSNPRAYLNLQALRANEPEMYERWLAFKAGFSLDSSLW